MDDAWWTIPCKAGRPDENMAMDEALLEHAERLGRPILRFYAWSVPAATFGCFQRYAEIAASTPLRPLIRRPTAGGFVPHDADWTYSVIIPPMHAWHALRATDSYCRVHRWIRDALSRLSIPAELAPARDLQAAGRCFAGGWEQHDLVRDGRKIAGAAQRRNRLGLLIQGSVQPVPRGVARVDWERAMLEVGGETLQARFEPFVPDPQVRARVDQLVAEKYSLPSHNESR
jgi:lipoate-protein ligase A